MKTISLIAALVLFVVAAPAETPTVPRHLAEAHQLLTGLGLDQTNYEHGRPNVIWNEPKSCRTDCSGFLDALFMHSYRYDRDALKRWLDSRRPTARRYHDAIVQGRGFTQLQSVTELRPGDVVAVKYLKPSDNTGHVMLADSAARPRRATHPVVDGTEQWELDVIDSSKSGHGVTDTRHKKGVDGKDHDGLGRGVFRLYTGKDGKIVAFTWSTMKVSQLKLPDMEDLVLGRLVPDYQP